MRDRAWRKEQFNRVAKKKMNIARSLCSGSYCRDQFEHNDLNQNVNLFENKLNLTCDCNHCIEAKRCEEVDYEKLDKRYKKMIEREYEEDFSFTL